MVSVLFLSGCGFKLNRNRVTLPHDAQSISLQGIENKSFTPGLDILLKEQLINLFSRNAIRLLPPGSADLSLQFQITSASYTRSDYALDDSTKTYEFTFSVSGRLTVVSNTDRIDLFRDVSLSGQYSLKTESADLAQTEISDGRTSALENLSDKIVGKLSQSF